MRDRGSRLQGRAGGSRRGPGSPGCGNRGYGSRAFVPQRGLRTVLFRRRRSRSRSSGASGFRARRGLGRRRPVRRLHCRRSGGRGPGRDAFPFDRLGRRGGHRLLLVRKARRPTRLGRKEKHRRPEEKDQHPEKVPVSANRIMPVLPSRRTVSFQRCPPTPPGPDRAIRKVGRIANQRHQFSRPSIIFLNAGDLATFFRSASFRTQCFTSPSIPMATFKYHKLSSISFICA